MQGDAVFPWARTYDADQLAAFIEDLWGAASGDNDLQTLDAIEKVIAEHRPDAAPSPLTRRQTDVLTELANGSKQPEAARTLGISEASVHTHVVNLFHTLQARTTTQAAVIAARHGWLPGLRTPEPYRRPPRVSCADRYQIHRRVAAELRENPGREATTGTYATRNGARTAAQAIRRGTNAHFQPAGSFAARHAADEQGRWAVFVRYLGEPTDTDTTEGTQT